MKDSVSKFQILEPGSLRAYLPGFLVCICIIVATSISWHDLYMDDAYIGFRCIDNFLSGTGFNFNPGERVESVTNVGWLLLLTPFSTLFRPHLAGKFAGIVSLVVAAFLISKIGVKYDQDTKEAGNDLHFRHILPLLAFSSPAFLYYSQSGMETAFLSILLVLPVFLKKYHSYLTFTALIYGVAFSVRPETLLVFPLFITAFIFVQTQCRSESGFYRKQILTAAAAWVAAIAMITLVRYAYFGDILPNTFYVKQSSVLNTVLRACLFLSGQLYNLPLPYSGLFLIPIVFLGFHQLYNKCPTDFPTYFAAATTGWFFSIYADVDWTLTPRYIAPYLPYCLISILAGLTNAELLSKPDLRQPVRIFFVFCFMIFLISNIFNGVIWFGETAMNSYPGNVITSRNLQQPVEEIRSLVSGSKVIATRRIGLIGYITRQTVFDYKFSLPHKDVVSAIKKSGLQNFDDPTNSYLFEIWQKRKPDYLLEDRKTIKAVIEKQDNNFECFQLHGITYRLLKTFSIGDTEDWMLYISTNS